MVDGEKISIDLSPLPASLRIKADRSGFDLILWTQGKNWVVVRCRSCGTVSRKRRSVVRDTRIECKHCIRARRLAAEHKIGVTLIGAAIDNHKYGLFLLPCGHISRRQYGLIEAAAQGKHKVGCVECREERYTCEAKNQGWDLVGPPTSGKPGYRNYNHRCGQRQDVSVGNMSNGDVDCSGCGESWSSKPSAIYLFWIGLSSGEVIKLGYSNNPRRRLRQQLKIAKGVRTKILRVIPMPTGHTACVEEKALHSQMKRTHAKLIVPKHKYGDGINTRTEIYRVEAREIILQMMDAVAARFPDTEDPDDDLN
ncbi:hypothetical protein PARPLA_01007 [Rhodobacteraceae bacterium THAF1]|uniref:GIY-YIG nuclease family protein n=1 Tax=Palleronia sp. THAF1 TaxID=2587842 RepID=UPI000F3FBFCA|nr:GIY-YIG nuclease family protein [Palleronia sp. THAF1]QFU07201.1 hypothetical protein FIU81_00770 [Palleronia sp. THAF1]VDC20610.1 hypothetical protein PARPLA_01007 [Rhodobacteraceae bacterium THAF1]